MLSNLIISVGILCLGFWLKGFDSIFAKIGGWILFVFGCLAVLQAVKWFFGATKGNQLRRDNPELAAAVDRALQGEHSSHGNQAGPNSSGATYEQATEEFKVELDRLAREHPDKYMGELTKMAAEIIKKRHPQFDAENQ